MGQKESGASFQQCAYARRHTSRPETQDGGGLSEGMEQRQVFICSSSHLFIKVILRMMSHDSRVAPTSQIPCLSRGAPDLVHCLCQIYISSSFTSRSCIGGDVTQVVGLRVSVKTDLG